MDILIRHFVILICTIIVCLSCVACIGRSPTINRSDESFSFQPLQMEYEEFHDAIEQIMGAGDVYINPRFQRDSSGSNLFVTFTHNEEDREHHYTAIFSPSGIKLVPSYSYVVFDDYERPIIRVDNGEILLGFSDPRSIPGLTLGSATVKPVWGEGPQYVLLRFPHESKASIVSLTNTAKSLLELQLGLIAPDYLVATANKLYIFRSIVHGNGYRRILAVYELGPDGFVLESERELPDWIWRVYDMDPESMDVLVTGSPGLFRRDYLYNLKSGKRRRLGFYPSGSLLVRRELADAIHKIFDEGVTRPKQSE